VVWEAAQFPTDYKDPLDAKFLEEEQGRLFVLFPGLKYLSYHAKYRFKRSRR
jgi:hypothetical protein